MWVKERGKKFVWLSALLLCLLAIPAWGDGFDLANGPIVVDATSPDVTITGTYREAGVGVTVKDGYNGKTLTLNSVDITNTTAGAVVVGEPLGVSMDLVLSGDNKLTGSDYALLMRGYSTAVTISGSGKLSVSGISSGSGIQFEGGRGASFVINGGYITAKGGDVASGGGGHGIFSAAPLKITGGEVAAGGGLLTGEGRDGDGIYANSSITISGGVVTASSGPSGCDLQSTGTGGGSIIIITGGSVSADRVAPTPKNSETDGDELTRSTLTGEVGQTVSLWVTGQKAHYPYTYTALFHEAHEGKAYVWLPTATSFDIEYPTITPTATNDNNGSSITLNVTTQPASVSGKNYQWQRETSGDFVNIPGATIATFIDTDLTNGKTYNYRVLVPLDDNLPHKAISKTISATVTGGGGGGGGVDTPQSMTGLLSALNEKLKPNVSVAARTLSDAAKAALAQAGYANPATITQLTENTANPFAAKTTPTGTPPAGYTITPQRPSFTTNINLSNGNGNLLALALSLNIANLDGYESWGTLTDAARAERLDVGGFILAYEYEDGTFVKLIPGTIESWAKALELGVVKFTTTGLVFNYAILDGEEKPFVAGDIIGIPDNEKDGMLNDPVWLLSRSVAPTGISLSPTSLALKAGESRNVTVTLTPAGATERDVVWSASDLATVFATASADVYTVKGLKAGTATLTAAASADRSVSASLSVTVLDLFESLTTNPAAPYYTDEAIEILAKLTHAPNGVTISIKRPDGDTDTLTTTVSGAEAKATYTPTTHGIYTATVTATDATGTYTRSISLLVLKGERDSSGGGCTTGLALLALPLLPMLKRRKR